MTQHTNIKDTIEKIKLEDYRYGHLVKRAQIFYWIFLAVYLITAATHFFEESTLHEILSSIFNIVGILIFALVLRLYSKEYNHVDYALPTLIMLKKAAYRYHPFRREVWYVALGIVMFNISLSLNEAHIDNILNLQITFAAVLALSVLIGLFVWKKQYKPIRDETLALIHQLEDE